MGEQFRSRHSNHVSLWPCFCSGRVRVYDSTRCFDAAQFGSCTPENLRQENPSDCRDQDPVAGKGGVDLTNEQPEDLANQQSKDR